MKLLPNVLSFFVLLMIVILSAAEPPITFGNGTLDGKTYATVLDGEDDELTFRDGSFQSSLGAGWGYVEGEYTTVAENNTIVFKANTVSSKKEKLFWTGVINGTAIQGSYLSTKKGWFLFGDTTKKKNFTGNLKTDK